MVEIRSVSESSSVYDTLTASLCSPGVVIEQLGRGDQKPS